MDGGARSAQHGARSGMEGSEIAWSGPAGREGSSTPSVSELGVTWDLGAMESDLG